MSTKTSPQTGWREQRRLQAVKLHEPGWQRKKIAVITPGVEARFHPRAVGEITPVLARYGLQPGFLFSLGRLNRRKNLGRLLQAFAGVRRRWFLAACQDHCQTEQRS